MKKKSEKISNESLLIAIQELGSIMKESDARLEVLYYELTDKVKLLAEGPTMTNERLDRFINEMRDFREKMSTFSDEMFIFKDEMGAFRRKTEHDLDTIKADIRPIKKDISKLNKEVFT
jgi:hypothetical protein